MNLILPGNLATPYKSPAQQARVVTESWAGDTLYCPACSASQLSQSPANTRAVDFRCPQCCQQFQLKAKSTAITNKVVDGAYDTMVAALRRDTAPNLFLLHYDKKSWLAKDLLLIPHFACPPSAIEKRRPLAVTARRAGWVGCFINLSNVPPDAKISIIRGGEEVSPERVRKQYQSLLPLKGISVRERGWTLDVLNLVRKLQKVEFSNEDVYAHTSTLEKLHSGNKHIRAKIRQQLQFLRDAGFLIHVERARWRLV